jgi:LPS-assembly protein
MRNFHLRPLAVACAIACALPSFVRAQVQGGGLDRESADAAAAPAEVARESSNAARAADIRGTEAATASDVAARDERKVVQADVSPDARAGSAEAHDRAQFVDTREGRDQSDAKANTDEGGTPAAQVGDPAGAAALATSVFDDMVGNVVADHVGSDTVVTVASIATVTGAEDARPQAAGDTDAIDAPDDGDGALAQASPSVQSDAPAPDARPDAAPERSAESPPAGSDGDGPRSEPEAAESAGAADGLGRGLRLERSPWPLPAEAAAVPTYVIADEIEGVASDEIEARGNAELRKPNAYLKADRIRYISSTDEVEAIGNVRLYKDGDLVTGPRLRMRVDQSLGVFEGTEFTLAPRERSSYSKPVEGRGTAAAVRLDGEDRYRVTGGRFTTCKPTETGWTVGAQELDIDFDRSVVTARDAKFTFLGMSTPTIPYATFSLNNERKSGFLPPLFGFQGKTGFELAVPYYFNIAPNQDATVWARYMEKRGLQGIGEYRYLGSWYSGILRVDYLPYDRILQEDRWAVLWRHAFNYQNRWSGYVNFNQVSDDNYFRDLSGRLAIATQTYLPREGGVTYTGGGWWNVSARVQDFQVLQSQTNPVPIPYARLPQITGNALYQTNLGLDAGMYADFTNFTAPGLPDGRRTIAYPYLTWPFLTAASFVVPKVGMNATYYDLSDVAPGTPTSQSRVLPIATVDSGLIFERETTLAGRPILQTLEPRLYYVWIPYKDQSQIPLFDTSVADLNYAQIFTENYYLGWDRISNANQLTAAVSTRIIVPTTGQEAFRALVGQRYYFTPQQVQLNPQTPLRTGSASPLLLAATGLVYPSWYADVAAQLASNNLQAERLNVGIRYQPGLNRLLNFSYRFTSSQIVTPEIHQIGVSGQWPLGGGFYGVGRFNYDLQGGQATELLGGIEYNAGCWILRVVGQSFPTSSVSRTNAVFVQFEFDGFSRIGSNPLEALRRNVPGYTPLNRRPDPNRPTFDYFE